MWRVSGFDPSRPIQQTNLPNFTTALVNNGPLMQVTIKAATIKPQNVPASTTVTPSTAPQPAVQAVALIDTGASMTAINSSIVQQTNLLFTGYQQIGGAHGVENCRVYFGEVHFP